MAAGSRIYISAFDECAERYDRVFTGSVIGQAQREPVWAELENIFHAGDRILEIGCGTGVDACYLAGHDVEVIACDSSPKMIAVAERRVRNARLSELVHPRLLAAEEITSLQTEAPFDGAFSNFGVLNCVPDLKSLAGNLAALLRPGATALLCCMGPFCLWETVWYMTRMKPAKALRRRQRGGTTARLDGGVPLTVYYPSVPALAQSFAPQFSIKGIQGIGVTVPPSYIEPYAKQYPRLMSAAVFADSILGRCPGVRLLADHILVRFERTTAL
jgi:SAM-dependent methyltransferase